MRSRYRPPRERPAHGLSLARMLAELVDGVNRVLGPRGVGHYLAICHFAIMRPESTVGTSSSDRVQNIAHSLRKTPVGRQQAPWNQCVAQA